MLQGNRLAFRSEDEFAILHGIAPTVLIELVLYGGMHNRAHSQKARVQVPKKSETASPRRASRRMRATHASSTSARRASNNSALVDKPQLWPSEPEVRESCRSPKNSVILARISASSFKQGTSTLDPSPLSPYNTQPQHQPGFRA